MLPEGRILPANPGPANAGQVTGAPHVAAGITSPVSHGEAAGQPHGVRAGSYLAGAQGKAPPWEP